ncbi:MAG TPA: hypothetical protein VFZ76_04705 [Anaerolineales bacterium]
MITSLFLNILERSETARRQQHSPALQGGPTPSQTPVGAGRLCAFRCCGFQPPALGPLARQPSLQRLGKLSPVLKHRVDWRLN